MKSWISKCRQVTGHISQLELSIIRKFSGEQGLMAAGSAPALNETSTIPNVYGEPFVKRHGLFFVTVASSDDVGARCVSRKDHDRSAVHQLGQERIRR
jgi:hypothetical protein